MEKTSEWMLTQGVLGVVCLVLMAALSVVFRLWMKERAECDAEKAKLHEAHKAEMRENGRTLQTMTERTLGAIDRLAELEERRR